MKTHRNQSGNLFTLVATEPYRRKSGSSTELDVWEALCIRPDCQESFKVKVPAGADPSKCKTFGCVHCATHRLTPGEVNARWLAACTAANTKAPPDMVTEMKKLRSEGVSCSTMALVFPLTENRIRVITRDSKPSK